MSNQQCQLHQKSNTLSLKGPLQRHSVAEPSRAMSVHPCCPFLSTPAHPHPQTHSLAQPPLDVHHLCTSHHHCSLLVNHQSRSWTLAVVPKAHSLSAGCAPLRLRRTARCCSGFHRPYGTCPCWAPCWAPCPHLQTMQCVPSYFSNMQSMLSFALGPRILFPLLSKGSSPSFAKVFAQMVLARPSLSCLTKDSIAPLPRLSLPSLLPSIFLSTCITHLTYTDLHRPCEERSCIPPDRAPGT